MIIKVPATTANIGPGYDSQGIALNIYNIFNIDLSESLEESLKNNLIYRSFKYFYDINNLEVPNISISVEAGVPIARGLGSSATCIVAGLMAANEFSGLSLSKQDLIRYATSMEGHSDNVAPALLGGHVVSMLEKNKIYFKKNKIDDIFKFYVLIPDFELKTSDARQAIPKEIDMAAAVSNVAKASLVSYALSDGDFEMFKAASRDMLHEPYRKELIDDYYPLQEVVVGNRGVMLISGAGPSLLVVAKKDNEKLKTQLNIVNDIGLLKAKWNLVELEVENDGAKIL